MNEKHKSDKDESHQNEIDSLDFMLLAEQSPNMIWLNVDGKVIYANQRCYELLGYTIDELCAPEFDFMTIIAPEYRDLIGRTYAKHIQGDFGLIFELDYELVTKDNSRLHCHLNTKLIDHKGQLAILGIVTDLSDIKKAHEALAESELKYHTVVDSIPDAVVVLNSNAEIVFANNETARIMDVPSKDDLLGMSVYDFALPENIELSKKRLARALAGGQNQPIVLTLLKPSGATLETKSLSRALDINGQPHILVIMHDHTEQKRLENELARNQEQVRNIIEHSPISIVVAGSDGSIRYVNDAACRLWDIDSPDIVIGCSFADYIHADSRQHSLARFSKALNGQLVVPEIIKAQQQDGTMFYLESVILSVEWDNEPAVMAIAHEVTENLQVEKKIREAKTKALQTISQGIAHEFRNLLTGVGNCVYSVMHKTEDAGSAALLESVMTEIKRGQAIIKELLLYSQTSSIALEALDFNSFLKSYLSARALKKLKEHDVFMKQSICEHTLMIKGNKSYLDIVISNIIHNSIEALTETKDKRIDIGLIQEDNWAVLSIKDNGVGMDKVQLESAMEPFYTTKAEHQSHGLGLSISSSLIYSMDGHIEITSSHNKGSIVKIFFPLLDESW